VPITLPYDPIIFTTLIQKMALDEFSRDKLIKINSVSVIDSNVLKNGGRRCGIGENGRLFRTGACKRGPF